MLRNRALFEAYVGYVFTKLADFGYERVEFRFEPFSLAEYSERGEIVSECSFSDLTAIIDKQIFALKLKHPNFSVGFILLGNKIHSPQ